MSQTGARPRFSGRLPVVATMIVSLLATGLMQWWTRRDRRALVNATPVLASESASLSNLNSFSLALLLGGLRGPLVMLLWSSSESQKQEKDLEDFDTKIELIRLLQPEFVSVHIFQMWNKAYNISAQMNSLANKYAAILDALDYGRRVDKERPHDLSLISYIGNLWFDKLGESQEKEYYTKRVMEESKWHEPDSVREGDPGWRRYRLDSMLDAKGNILPQYLEPHGYATPVARSSEGERNDGSELQYLKEFQPFPYGIPPRAMGYDYAKRAQVLQDTTYQKDIQVSAMVVDDSPAVKAKLWAEWEWEHGRRMELKALGKTDEDSPDFAQGGRPRASDRTILESETASLVGPGTIKNPSALAEAMYCYELVEKIVPVAMREYDRDLRHYSVKYALYQQHKADMRAMADMLRGDYDCLALDGGLAKDPAKVTADAIADYRKAVSDYEMILLKGYTDDLTASRVFPPGMTRGTLNESALTEQQLDDLLARAVEYARVHKLQEGNDEDRGYYGACLDRARTRLAVLRRPSAAGH